jgi:hypothetical protein
VKRETKTFIFSFWFVLSSFFFFFLFNFRADQTKMNHHLAQVLLVALCSTSMLLMSAAQSTVASTAGASGDGDSATATNASEVPDLPKVVLNVTGASFPQNLIRCVVERM